MTVKYGDDFISWIEMPRTEAGIKCLCVEVSEDEDYCCVEIPIPEAKILLEELKALIQEA